MNPEIAELERELKSLQEQLYHTRTELMDVLEQRDDARARGDYWQGVAQGDSPWEYD